jgi:uncharacterized protein
MESGFNSGTTHTADDGAESQAVKWQPLNSRQRRVVGVLIEKAKTTPDAYPMTLNSLTAGCNQKSNRSPQMNLSSDDIETVLEELRAMGAVVEVQTSGRVPKYRHQMYDWLGVDKVELAVMAELLLRGEQTVGELRSRAARMEPISGIDQLRPVLQSLLAKKLVISLSPEGRGQIVSHGLYKDRELADLQSRAAGMAAEQAAGVSPAERSVGQASPKRDEALEAFQAELQQLREALAEVKSEVEELKALMQ